MPTEPLVIGELHPSIRDGYRPHPSNADLITDDDMRAAFGGLDTPAGKAALRRIVQVCCQNWIEEPETARPESRLKK